MRITALLSLYALAFIILVSGVIALSLWDLKRSQYWEERTDLAHSSLQSHLALQSLVYQLFKQHGDALLIGDRDEGLLERELKSAIATEISRIRAAIAGEIDMVGDEELDELEVLAQIETKVQEVTAKLTWLTDDGRPIDPAIRLERLADVLDRTVDLELSQLIAEAIAEEAEEVAETRALAETFRQDMRLLTYSAAALATLLLLLAFWSYVRLIQRPFADVMERVSDYRKGDFSRPLQVSGGKELRHLSHVLNEMARGLENRAQEQLEQNDKLEEKVRDRTSELQKLLAQIELSETNRRRLMADISHELRTPLTIIQGEAEVALRSGEQPYDVTADVLARIRDAARHTTHIVEDMLLIARHEAGHLRLDLKDVDLRRIVAEAQDMFASDVEVTINAKDTRIRVDPLRMRQCILSVLHNAQRYGGPNIQITLNDDGNHISIVLQDDGPGMSDQDKAQAFDRFFRGSNAAGQASEGTGLGLPIVRAIMNAHDGSVMLEDAETGGLRVILSIPRKRQLSVVNEIGENTRSRAIG